jgi:hypothetical protein
MHEHRTRHDSSDAKASRPARVPQGADVSAAGNRAMAEVLGPRPVQRWPDLGDLGGLLGGGPTMGNPTPDLGGSMPSMPSLPSMPDLGGYLPDMPSMPSMPDLGGLIPSMPTASDLPGVNLNVDTDAGTASGGVDFHNGTSGRASYGPGGVDVSGQTGRASVGGHASSVNDWNVHGGTTTSGGTKIGGSVSNDHGAYGGNLGVVGSGGDTGSLSGHAGRGGFGGLGSYVGEYGNLGLPF